MTWNELLLFIIDMRKSEREKPIKVFDYDSNSFCKSLNICVEGEPPYHLVHLVVNEYGQKHYNTD